MREFLARLNALLRRVRLIRKDLAAERAGVGLVATPGGTLAFGDLAIDQARREVVYRGEPLHLKPKEYDLLVCLAHGRGSALSRDVILDQVWGGEYDGAGRTVDVHVRWLRGKIEADPTHPTRILTVRGVGYRFEG
jgi:DNA-binding response OmpR family regulator